MFIYFLRSHRWVQFPEELCRRRHFPDCDKKVSLERIFSFAKYPLSLSQKRIHLQIQIDITSRAQGKAIPAPSKDRTQREIKFYDTSTVPHHSGGKGLPFVVNRWELVNCAAVSDAIWATLLLLPVRSPRTLHPVPIYSVSVSHHHRPPCSADVTLACSFYNVAHRKQSKNQ